MAIYYWKEFQRLNEEQAKLNEEQAKKEAEEKEKKLQEIKEKEFHQIAESSGQYFRNQIYYTFNFCDHYPLHY